MPEFDITTPTFLVLKRVLGHIFFRSLSVTDSNATDDSSNEGQRILIAIVLLVLVQVLEPFLSLRFVIHLPIGCFVRTGSCTKSAACKYNYKYSTCTGANQKLVHDPTGKREAAECRVQLEMYK